MEVRNFFSTYLAKKVTWTCEAVEQFLPSQPDPRMVMPTDLPSLRQREPLVFARTPDIDVADCLKHYERVTTHNRWDGFQFFEPTKNKSPRGTVLLPLLNKISKNPIPDDSKHRTDWLEVFRQSESSTTYIQGVLRLCSLVGTGMREADKV